jgi:hypothetical protein
MNPPGRNFSTNLPSSMIKALSPQVKTKIDLVLHQKPEEPERTNNNGRSKK